MFPFFPPFGGGNGFPYTNMHDLNMDWIIAVVKDFLNKYTHVQELLQESTAEGIAELEAKKNQLEALLNQWYNTHSQDIANELSDALQDIQEYTAGVIASIPADYSDLGYKVQDFINYDAFNSIYTESGTYRDDDGNTKNANNARRRNRSPIPVADIAYLTIPSGYEIYIYCLDGFYTKFSVVNWTNTELNTINLPNNTKYINFAVRKIASPDDDISNTPISLGIIKRDTSVVPRWNISERGIYISGNSIVVENNGFTFSYNYRIYTIAPIDLESVTTFSANAGDVKALVINVKALTAGVRNDPSSVMQLLDDIPYSLSSDKYITVATYYKNYWDFCGAFTYYNQIGKITPEPDYVSWNNKSGGMYKSQNSIIVNTDGFRITYNGHTYYIAPIDNTTVTTYTPDNLMDTVLLVIDPVKLTNPGIRNNPSDVLSLVAYRGDSYAKQYITVATFYKGTWSFNGKFRMMDAIKPVPVNNWFNTQRIIAHKGGNATTPNTMENFQSAIENGYKFIETDAQITSDNIVVLHHDTTITIGGTTYTIANLTYAQLHSLAPTIPLLTDLLTLAKKNDVIIDLDCTKRQSADAITVVYNTVKKMGCMSRVMFTCSIANAKQILNNGQAIVCLTEVDTQAELDSIYDIIAQASLCVCSVQYNNYTENIVNMIHSYGALVKVWTVNNATNINTLFDKNVDMVISDSIRETDL